MISNDLTDVLNYVRGAKTQTYPGWDVDDIEEFIDVGEPELAFESLYSIIYNEHLDAPASIKQIMLQLMTVMGYDNAVMKAWAESPTSSP